MPHRRESVTQKATVAGKRVYLTVGTFEDGSPGEIFVTVEGAGSEQRMLYDVIARLFSMGLQHGMPLGKGVEVMLGVRGEIAGPVTHHGRIKMASSIVDYVARELAISYLGREDLAHVVERSDERMVAL